MKLVLIILTIFNIGDRVEWRNHNFWNPCTQGVIVSQMDSTHYKVMVTDHTNNSYGWMITIEKDSMELR